MPKQKKRGCDRGSFVDQPKVDHLAADVLRRCAGGELSPAVALVRLLIAYRDLDSLRPALAKLHQADGAADLHGAIERLHCLLDGKSEASALVLHMLEQEPAGPQPEDKRTRSRAAGVCSTGWWR